MPNNSFFTNDQSVVMQPNEKGEFTHHLCTLRKELCTSAANIRKYAEIPNTIDFRIVVPADGFVVEIFVRKEDWQKMETEKRQYSLSLLAVILITVIIGVILLIWSMPLS